MQPATPSALPLFIHAPASLAEPLAKLAEALDVTPEETARAALASALPSFTDARADLLPALRNVARRAFRLPPRGALGSSCALFFTAEGTTADALERLALRWNISPAAVAEGALALTVEDLADPLCGCLGVLREAIAENRAAFSSLAA